MLGRHADSLFWMARYLERSENNARRIQAAFHYALSRADDGREEWKTIISENASATRFDFLQTHCYYLVNQTILKVQTPEAPKIISKS